MAVNYLSSWEKNLDFGLLLSARNFLSSKDQLPHF
jgi:hypothetical protein